MDNAIRICCLARTGLIARVSLKGVEYGITEDNIEAANADSVGGKSSLLMKKTTSGFDFAEINDKGYKQVMEEVAYTWFNPLLCFTIYGQHGYIPSHACIHGRGKQLKPQIITEAIHLFGWIGYEKVYELKDAEKTETV